MKEGLLSDSDRLLNVPMTVVVGRGDSEKKVLLTAPSNHDFAEHMQAVQVGIGRLVQRNLAFFKALKNGKARDAFDEIDLDFSGMTSSMNELVATLVGEDAAFVEHEMTPAQTLKVMVCYMELVEFETLKSLFLYALQRFIDAKPVTAGTSGEDKPVTPPFVEQ